MIQTFKLVPISPTEEMLDAAIEVCLTNAGEKVLIPLELQTKLEKRGYQTQGKFLLFTGKDEYKAMLSAYPQDTNALIERATKAIMDVPRPCTFEDLGKAVLKELGVLDD